MALNFNPTIIIIIIIITQIFIQYNIIYNIMFHGLSNLCVMFIKLLTGFLLERKIHKQQLSFQLNCIKMYHMY